MVGLCSVSYLAAETILRLKIRARSILVPWRMKIVFIKLFSWQDANVWKTVSECFYAIQRFEHAASAARKSLNINSKNEEVSLLLARSQFNVEAFDESLEAYKNCKNLVVDQDIQNRFVACCRLGRHKEAMELAKSITLDGVELLELAIESARVEGMLEREHEYLGDYARHPDIKNPETLEACNAQTPKSWTLEVKLRELNPKPPQSLNLRI